MESAPERNTASLAAPPADTPTLRSQLRDLIAILALPAVWSGRDAADIPEALLEVVSSMLRLDLAYIRAADPAGGGPSETACVLGRPDLGHRASEIAGVLAQSPSESDASQTLVLPHPVTGEPLRATRIVFGLEGHTDVVIAASRRSSFPTPVERFLLQSIVTQGEIALRNAALMTALHHALHCEQVARADAEAASRAKDQLNEELERRVVERTRQVTVVNEELRREIAERTLAEEALHQARQELAHVTRVTTLGEFAASIAHEVNQPLAAIVADANACLHWLEADRPPLDSVREALAAVVNDGNRAGEVITRIRAFLSRSSVAHRPCDLAGVIRDVLLLVGPELGRHGTVLHTSLATDLPPVMGDRVQLQQVLLNLLLNAAEAVREVPPERRRLVVRATLEQREDGSWAVVAVEDAGVGFGEDEAARLFEAFYTTKPGGLGMGLSISRSIVDGHRGRLWATANPGHGATFQFALPGMR